MSAAGRALSKALDSPNDCFTISRNRLTHEPTGLIFWIGNGGFFFDGYDSTPRCLGLLERHWLYWKFKRRAVAAVARKLSTVKTT